MKYQIPFSVTIINYFNMSFVDVFAQTIKC